MATINGTGGADINLHATINGGADDSIDGMAGDDGIYALSGNDSVLGGDGNDTVYGGWGMDTLVAGAGNDSLFGDFEGYVETIPGSGGADSIDGGDGNDSIFAGNGSDTLIGGAGADSIFGDFSGDTLPAVPGNDSIDGGAGDDTLAGEDGNDVLLGGDSNDLLVGGNGADTLDGGAGYDELRGGAGDDFISGGDDGDQVYAGDGNDTVLGGAGDDLLWGDFLPGGIPAPGNDSIDGGDGNDGIEGEAGDDTLMGGAGDDYLQGEDGNDTLAGGTGTNTMSGGAGNDTYVVSSLDDQIDDSQGTNHVVVAIDGYKAPSGTAFDAPEFIDGAQALPYFIDALYNGTRWGTFGGGQVTLTYSFMTQQGTQYDPDDVGTFQEITDSGERQVIVDALAAWAAVANIKFVARADGSNSDLRFGANQQTGSAGYATLPDGNNGYSEIYLNLPHAGNTGSGVVDYVVLHEIGHALGLKHSFQPALPGGTDDLLDGVHDGEDTVSNTLMSYTGGGSEHQLQEFDVAAIQYLYGPKTGTNAGATSYTFPDHWISDASGIDTFNAAIQALPVHLDINDGRWSWVDAQSASILDPNQVFINFNTFIEKAIGGSGNDTIIGNELANTLTGNGGDDSMSGGAGNDLFIGNAGDDWMSGGAGNDTFTGSAGNDTMAGGAGDDVYKTAKGDVVVEAAGEGRDRVESAIAYTLGAEVEDLTLTGGAKRGTGNGLDNLIVGNAAADSLNGAGGNDTLDGGAGADKLTGGVGDDAFVWDAADMVAGMGVLGGSGTDVLLLGGSQSIDLTLVDNSICTGMERITLGGTNALTLAATDLTDLSTSTDTLYVDGDSGDNVYLSGAGWTHNANPVAGYDIWKNVGLGATLRVDSDIHVSVLGT